MRSLIVTLLTLLVVSALGVTMAGNAFAFHPLFLTASKTTLSFTGTSKLALLRGLMVGVLGTIDCEKSASSGQALFKSTLATKVEVEYSGKCEQTIVGVKTACTEPIKFKLTFVELGLVGTKKVGLLMAPESGTELVKVTCGSDTSTFEGAVVAEFPENNSILEKQYNTSRSSLELVFKSESKNQNQAITSIELSGVSMTKVLLKVSGFFGGNASIESTQTISFDSGALICTTSPSACGSASGGKESTTLTTTLSGEGKENPELTILEGSKAKDKATLSGKNAGSATGKVKYKIYSDSKCETLVKEAGEVTVTGGSVPASNEEELEAGKTYYWQATYEGDSLNSASTSSCGSEVLNVKAKTAISLKLAAEGKEGEELTIPESAKVKGKATLSGTNIATATGKVLYTIYTDNKCEHLLKEAGEVVVAAGAVPASNEEKLEGEAIYYWQATYSGDALHQASTSACGGGKGVLNVLIPRPVNGEKACNEFMLGESNDCDEPLTSGVTIQSEEGGTCTAGPLAIPIKEPERKERTYLLTAGHCIADGSDDEGDQYNYLGEGRSPFGRPGAPEGIGNPNCETRPGEPWWGEKWFAFTTLGEKVEIGRAGSYMYTNNDDFGEICITNPEWMTGNKKDPLWPVTAEWDSPEERFIVKELREPKENEDNCHEGQTTGHSCGEVTEVPVVRAGPVVTNFVKVENGGVDSKKGDSGGPWYFRELNGEALMTGIHSHTLFGFGAVGEPRYYENLTPALEWLELELLTPANEVR